MCGILGGSQKNWDYRKGLEEIAHRGPDGHRIEEYPEFTLGFVRLAVMDLSEEAMQPMLSQDRMVSIVFNGEIYGFSQLKRILESRYYFYTTSDTEVILNAYLEYGDDFINHIDGMFAIAIYDKRINQVKLFRDRTGIKPLYYYYDGRKFAFASEIKALTALCTDALWNYDTTALYDYLFYQYIPEPKTMYRNLYKLPPAYKIQYDVKKQELARPQKYWRLKVNPNAGRRRKSEDINDEIRYLIRKSIQDQMVADVPVGTYLSGGLDSSIVTLECSRIKQDIRTFTIGFHEDKYDESRFAKMMIEKYNINSKMKVLDKSQVEGIKGSMKRWYDEPFADTSAYPTFVVSKLAREEVTVVLTGDGSDELFGGYRRYEEYLKNLGKCENNSKYLESIACKAAEYKLMKSEVLEKYFLTGLSMYSRLLGFKAPFNYAEFAHNWKIPKDYDAAWHLRKYYNKDLPPLTRCRYLDFKTYLPGDILTKVDRTSMAVSLEARVPFLSREVVEFAFSLSQEECCPKENLKGILKDAYKDAVPKEIINRVKRGFSIPPLYLRKEKEDDLPYAGILKREWPDIWKAGCE